MRITIVGCSGSFAGPQSAASSYLVEADDETGRTWRLVLDLGSGAFGSLQQHVEPVDVDALAISHLHPDHFTDITGLEVYRRYHPHYAQRCGQSRLPVFGPAGIARRVELVSSGEIGDESCAVFDYREWEDRGVYEIGPLTITAFRVRHPVPAYAMRIVGPSSSEDGGTAVFTYSGDTDECDALLEAARDADLLLSEAAFVTGRDDDIEGVHLTGRKAGAVAVRAGAKALALTHVPAWNNAGVAAAEAAEVYAGPLREVVPGFQFVI